ncbi:hypothetical protein P775_08765 [Puniceibacterium antarcticum]|uniref:Uncharacterized protein n=1 Tax=Puniceibacterium antarcticum TaxID=1206336 RepID=A0A2G8RHM7_9RHOB|nr:hypothetical protein P775_08765 [Puniceibacterium antarcticum]
MIPFLSEFLGLAAAALALGGSMALVQNRRVCATQNSDVTRDKGRR